MSPTPRPSFSDRVLCAWRRRGWRGLQTIRGLIPGARSDGRVLLETRYGSQFLLDPIAYIDGHVIVEGFYESEVLEALRPYLTTGATLWDIGANFGLHAISAARLYPSINVVAFEPNPAEHARLTQHRQWNAPNVLACSCALSDTSGVVPLHLGPLGNSGMTTLSPWAQGTYSGILYVATVTGDDLVSRGTLPPPSAIKLDVEGHESAVLRGLASSLRLPACRAVVFEDSPQDATESKDILRAAGFEISALSRVENTGHLLTNFLGKKR